MDDHRCQLKICHDMPFLCIYWIFRQRKNNSLFYSLYFTSPLPLLFFYTIHSWSHHDHCHTEFIYFCFPLLSMQASFIVRKKDGNSSCTQTVECLGRSWNGSSVTEVEDECWCLSSRQIMGSAEMKQTEKLCERARYQKFSWVQFISYASAGGFKSSFELLLLVQTGDDKLQLQTTFFFFTVDTGWK